MGSVARSTLWRLLNGQRIRTTPSASSTDYHTYADALCQFLCLRFHRVFVDFNFLVDRSRAPSISRSCLFSCRCLHQSGQDDDDEDDVAVDDRDYLNEDELAELQRDEENIKKEVQ